MHRGHPDSEQENLERVIVDLMGLSVVDFHLLLEQFVV